MNGANCCTKSCLSDAAHFFFRAAVCVRNKRKPAFQSGSKIGGFGRDLNWLSRGFASEPSIWVFRRKLVRALLRG
jgi:hypothetical protein